MQSKKIRWEASILAFAIIFTVLIGTGNILAAVFDGAVPWVIILVVTVAITIGINYIPRRDQR
ncbi:MAG: hypothetical protein GFH27_549289n424 [Chloroflexi bacterium AL-W]|nr:hypothetical protein [Chloroflexi bacterium AL-N1]NOK67156.1 hypothetical protein [Chloroflexi bacterium AL-N10]NOK74551.1 hypothetical protein [Chloroflexi bacterium AL-N5]NOK81758.1 hypothetical protein [Chloroflexi bacterium AL-W]NOK89228.1 hypothetical protein [Chloroflexi bacterium AL-N15]